MSNPVVLPFVRNANASPVASAARRLGHAGRGPVRALLIAGAMALGGCSADITRFDLPGSAASSHTPKANVGAGSLIDERAAPSGPITGGGLPPVAQRSPSEAGRRASAADAPMPAASPIQADAQRHGPAVVTASVPPAPAKGEAIEVQQGDTLYALSKRHKVSISELMSVNDLTTPNLRLGQKLHLPAGKRAARPGPQKPLVRPEAVAALGPGPVSAAPASPQGAAPASAPVPVPADARAASTWHGSYTIKSGDSLYGIARQHKIALPELLAVNGIADPRKVRPGTLIKVPGAAVPGAAVAEAPANPLPAASGGAEPAPVASWRQTVVTAPDKRERFAAVAPETVTDAISAPRGADMAEPVRTNREPAAPAISNPAVPPAVPLTSKLRWPVKGKVIARFGPRMGGTQNYGVNLAVPMGTDVHAAEAGIVNYAGSELSEFGNLVLIRHDNNMVTAYAHNDQLLVRFGDTVKRGQVIAKAGKSGMVDQPQVHFELRQGMVPIDPAPYMEKM